MRGGEYRCKILEIHCKLSNQQLKTVSYMYRQLYQNIMGAANQKPTIDKHTKKKKQFKYNTKAGHQTTTEGKRKGRRKTNKNKHKTIKKIQIVTYI